MAREMPFKVADRGASGGALGDASMDDLERGFTRLRDAAQVPDILPAVSEEVTPAGQMDEAPVNQTWTEHDAGGFLDRAHGHER